MLLATAAAVAIAPFSVHAQDTKIGVIDFQRVVLESPQAEEVSKRLETEFAPRRAELLAMQEKLKTDTEKLTRDGPVMSTAQRETSERELRDLQRNMQRGETEFVEDVNARRNEELMALQDQIVKRVNAYATEEDFDLILAEAVFASDAIDITEDVLAMLKDE